MNEKYEFRNLPCNMVPEKELWCIVGSFKFEDGFSGSGILEWCYNEADAFAQLEYMQQFPGFSGLAAEKYIEESPEKYFISKIGELFAGKSNPDEDTYREITFAEFSEFYNVAEYAFGGWYNIYK